MNCIDNMVFIYIYIIKKIKKHIYLNMESAEIFVRSIRVLCEQQLVDPPTIADDACGQDRQPQRSKTSHVCSQLTESGCICDLVRPLLLED